MQSWTDGGAFIELLNALKSGTVDVGSIPPV